MKTTSSIFVAFVLKALIIITCITVGFTSFTTTHAQSIVGKWNQLSTKQFFTAEEAKKIGKTIVETQMSTMGSVVFDFKSNHTYVLKSSSKYDPKESTRTGTWILSGDNIQMTFDDPKYNPKKGTDTPITTVLIKENTMMWSTLYPNSKVTSKVEITFTRM